MTVSATHEITIAPGQELVRWQVAGAQISAIEVTKPIEISFDSGRSWSVFDSTTEINQPHRGFALRNRTGSSVTAKFNQASEAGAFRRRALGEVQVKAGSERIGNWQAVQVGDVAVEIAQADPNRVSITINAGGQALYIGGEDTVAPGEFGRLGAGEEVTLQTRGAVWAIRDAAVTADAGTFEEFSK